VICQGSDGGGSQTTVGATTNGQMEKADVDNNDLSSLADEKVELLCNDQVVFTLSWIQLYEILFTI